MTFTCANDVAGETTIASATTAVVMDPRPFVNMAFNYSVEVTRAKFKRLVADRAGSTSDHRTVTVPIMLGWIVQ